MAGGGCDGRAGNNILELEAMRKDTFSWHPCQVSLRPKTFGLMVQYEDTNLEEVISSKDGVLAGVRVRSTPLQGDDCYSLRQGDIVLATQNSKVRLFCDAQVKEVIHARHSKRNCKCSFKIQWLHRSLEEKTLTVPASAIKILSTKSIILHSIIAAFFCMVDSSTNELKTSLLAASVHGMNLEADVNMPLEKQIKKMNKLADAPDKKISDSDNIAFKLKADLKRPTHATAVDLSLKNPSVNIPIPNGLKGSDGSKNKELLDTKAIDYTTNPILSNQDPLMTSRSPLSPLAARAALAMLRSNLPEGAAARSNVETEDITSPAAALSKISATLGGKSSTSIATRLFPASDMQKKRKTEEPSEKRATRTKFSNGIHESTQVTNLGETPTMSSNKDPRVARSTIEPTMELEPNAEDALPDSEKGNFSEASDGHSSSRRITRSAAAAQQGVGKKTNAQLKNQRNITSESTKLRNVTSPIAALGRKNDGDADTHDNTTPISTGGTRNKTSPSPLTQISHRPRTRSQK